MIISNWNVVREQGTFRISGKSIDSMQAPDGSPILTSAIQFSEKNVIKTTSGSVYYLGKPESTEAKEILKSLQNLLPDGDIPNQPFTAIIEDWEPAITGDNKRAFAGSVYGYQGAEDGKQITTSQIVARQGNCMRTASGSLYVLASHNSEKVPLGAKAKLLNALGHAEQTTQPHFRS